MLPLRQRPFNRQQLRRHLLALLLTAGVCELAAGDEAPKLVPLSPPTTTLQIRTATRSWDDSKPEKFQPTLRFRAPVTAGGTLGASDQLLDTDQKAVVGATASDEWMTNDNWVARDAVNLKQPLRDPGGALPANAKPPVAAPPRSAPPVAAAPPVAVAPPAVAPPPVAAPPPAVAPPVAEASKSTLGIPSASRPPTFPAVTAPKTTKVPSATLAPPVSKPIVKPDAKFSPTNRIGDDAENSLQLVQPSELGALKAINSPALSPLDTAPSQRPEKTSVGDLPSKPSDPKPSTAVEALLEPALNAPIQLDAPTRPVAKSMEPSKSKPVPSSGGEREADSNETSSTRGEMQFRRLRIERDGSPSEPQAISEVTPPTSSNPTAVGKSAISRRVKEGDNEPLQSEQSDAAPALDDEAASRLNAVPRSESKLDREPQVAVSLDYTGRPLPRMQVSTTVRRMQPTMKSCLSYYHAHPDDAAARSNWGMLHQIMVYGAETNITTGRQTYNAIAWIAGNNACRGQRILGAGPRGIEAKSGVGLQGHQGQMLAVLSLCNVPESYPLYVARDRYSVKDLVREEMATCKSGEELTFSLIALSHYLSTDDQWRSADGQTWDCERLIREELSQPIVGAACGGTHRLMGFSHALRHRRAEGGEMTGQWLRAEKFLEDFVKYTYQLQNRDGSMSTAWFEERQDNGDMDRKVQTTGHMVEWLLTVTPDEDLQNPQLVSAVRYLLGAMNSERGHDWQIGPKGHALRSLAMYYDRVYQDGSAWANSASVARSTTNSRR